MPRIILDLGFLKVSSSYLQRRPSGRFYYYRRIPLDLRTHYLGKVHRLQSLKTSSEHEALRRVAKLAAGDDALWASLRTNQAKDLGLTTTENREAARALVREWGLSEGDGHRTGPEAQKLLADVVDVMDGYFTRRYEGYARSRGDDWYAAHVKAPHAFYDPVETEAVRLVMSDPTKSRALLSDALVDYLKNHKNGEKPAFVNENTMCVNRAISAVGDLPLSDYKREHAVRVRDHLIEADLATSSVRRNLNTIRAVFNHGLTEFDLSHLGNPFNRLKIANEGKDTKRREVFSAGELKAIRQACESLDDEIRYLVAIQADTGARLGEIVGLRIEDVFLGHDVPHVHIRPHEHLGRTLKNANSERKVPVVGVALWGITRALEARNGQREGWLFPRYAEDNNIKATHASNTVNKWLSTTLNIPKTSHSFRHAMRDRLRHVDAPEEIQDAIGGWGNQSASVGRGYGQGHLLEQLKVWLKKVVVA